MHTGIHSIDDGAERERRCQRRHDRRAVHSTCFSFLLLPDRKEISKALFKTLIMADVQVQV